MREERSGKREERRETRQGRRDKERGERIEKRREPETREEREERIDKRGSKTRTILASFGALKLSNGLQTTSRRVSIYWVWICCWFPGAVVL